MFLPNILFLPHIGTLAASLLVGAFVSLSWSQVQLF
jgi:hypothetical protein